MPRRALTTRRATVFITTTHSVLVLVTDAGNTKTDVSLSGNLSLDEYRLLSLVENEPLVQKVLACDMGRTCAAISRWVTILSRLELVVRQSEKSARECEVSITRRGRYRLKLARARLSEQCGTLGAELTGSDRDLLKRVEGNLRRFVSLVCGFAGRG